MSIHSPAQNDHWGNHQDDIIMIRMVFMLIIMMIVVIMMIVMVMMIMVMTIIMILVIMVVILMGENAQGKRDPICQLNVRALEQVPFCVKKNTQSRICFC